LPDANGHIRVARQRANREFGIKATSMSPLAPIYDFYKKEFGLGSDALLDKFETLLNGSTFSVLECSPMVSSHGIHGARFRAGSVGRNIPEGFGAIFDFLDGIMASGDFQLDSKGVTEIVDRSFDLSKMFGLAVGIDRKEKIGDSKVKCYFMIINDPKTVERVLSRHPVVERLGEYFVQDTFLFAVDLYLDGGAGVEIYARLQEPEIRDKRLLSRLNVQKDVLNLIEASDALTISFEDKGMRVFHFHPLDPFCFVRLIDHRPLSLLYGRARIGDVLAQRSKDLRPAEISVAFLEDEINSRKLQNVRLYYRVERRN
jgi:LynF/TruF/PatF family peptide O-prenyltransferase